MKSLLATLSFLVLSIPAQAYYSTMDTGELVAPGAIRATLEPQYIFNRYEGGNVIARAASGINESSSFEGLLGFGEIDYQFGGFYKFIPFPDVEGQPAIGGKVGVLVARANHQNEVSFRAHPLISKQLDTEFGKVTPYASLPFGVTTRDNETFVPVQLAAGAEWKIPDNESFRIMAELGINLNHSFSYLSLGFVYLFDEQNAPKLKTR
jgi:hypothetical protein